MKEKSEEHKRRISPLVKRESSRAEVWNQTTAADHGGKISQTVSAEKEVAAPSTKKESPD